MITTKNYKWRKEQIRMSHFYKKIKKGSKPKKDEEDEY